MRCSVSVSTPARAVATARGGCARRRAPAGARRSVAAGANGSLRLQEQGSARPLVEVTRTAGPRRMRAGPMSCQDCQLQAEDGVFCMRELIKCAVKYRGVIKSSIVRHPVPSRPIVRALTCRGLTALIYSLPSRDPCDVAEMRRSSWPPSVLQLLRGYATCCASRTRCRIALYAS